MRRMESTLGFILIVFTVVSTLQAQDSGADSKTAAPKETTKVAVSKAIQKQKNKAARALAGRKIVVTKEGAQFHIPDGPTIDAQIGKLYEVNKIKSSWLWVVRTGGWMDVGNVIDNGDAEAHFTSLIKSTPTTENFFHRGIMRSANGRYHRALSDFESAMRLDPTSAKAVNGQGNCLWATGDVETALAAYNRAIELDSELAPAYNNRGNAQRTLGEFEAALSDYDRAIELAGEVGIIYNNRGTTFMSMGRLEAAIEDFSRAILADAHDSDAFNNRGFALQMQGEFEQAIANYRRAAQFDGKYFRAFNNAAWLRATCPNERFRDAELAMSSAQEACELTNYRLWFCLATMAAAHAEAGNFDAAVQSQLKAISLMPATTTQAEMDEQTGRVRQYQEERPYRAKDYGNMARTLKRALR